MQPRTGWNVLENGVEYTVSLQSQEEREMTNDHRKQGLVALALFLTFGCGGSQKVEDDAVTDTGGTDDATDVTTDVSPDGADVSTDVSPDAADVIDEEVVAGCTSDDDCDDGNPCNGEETCGGDGECVDGTPLEDGEPCSRDGVDGECAGGACVPLTCGDGVVDAGEDCDDANDTPDDGCEPDCTFSCMEDTECDDGNPCTDDACVYGGEGRICEHTPNTEPCDDGDPCTDPDVCADGSCQPGPNVCGCTVDADCDEYEDGDLCNGTLVCNEDSGNCEVDPATVVDCGETGNPCTEYECDPATGDCDEVDLDAGTPCDDDEDACTVDTCDGSGACTHEAVDCDDGDPCTTDSCDSATGCIHDDVEDCCETDAECDDEDACTVDTCTPENTCTHEARDCDDDDLCTVDVCDPATGCTHEAVDCDDGDPCTLEICEPSIGCAYAHAPPGTECDDENDCTVDDECNDSGECIPGDPATEGSPCDDGTNCTDPDECDDSGHCVPGPWTGEPAWWEDADDDGFGDPDSMICQETRPPGYVDNDEDCCDSEPEAYPDHDVCYADPFVCEGSTEESWDYNCHGTDYKCLRDWGECDSWIMGCHFEEGWVDPDPWSSSPLPECGEWADYITGCDGSCEPIVESVQMTCM
jgi:hypothetical protein